MSDGGDENTNIGYFSKHTFNTNVTYKQWLDTIVFEVDKTVPTLTGVAITIGRAEGGTGEIHAFFKLIPIPIEKELKIRDRYAWLGITPAGKPFFGVSYYDIRKNGE